MQKHVHLTALVDFQAVINFLDALRVETLTTQSRHEILAILVDQAFFVHHVSRTAPTRQEQLCFLWSVLVHTSLSVDFFSDRQPLGLVQPNAVFQPAYQEVVQLTTNVIPVMLMLVVIRRPSQLIEQLLTAPLHGLDVHNIFGSPVGHGTQLSVRSFRELSNS